MSNIYLYATSRNLRDRYQNWHPNVTWLVVVKVTDERTQHVVSFRCFNLTDLLNIKTADLTCELNFFLKNNGKFFKEILNWFELFFFFAFSIDYEKYNSAHPPNILFKFSSFMLK